VTKTTIRDRVWSAAFERALAGQTVSVATVRKEADLDRSSDRTIRDVLNTMVAEGWLEKFTKQSHSWSRGPAIDRLAVCEECGSVWFPEGLTQSPGDSDDRKLCSQCSIMAAPL
jgi:hypothetical protein